MDEDYDRDDVRRSDRGHNSRRHLGGMAMKRELVMRTFMLGRKGTEKTIEINDPMRFAGDGVSFKAKLIGVLEVAAPRGDRLCQEALAELKMAVKAAGEHKQRILICIALDGLRLRDERSGDCLYHHPVHKISFIAQDMTDTRAFGYIFGSPDQGHRFFGIKTDKGANTVVMAMRDLFQVVYDLKKKEIERARLQAENQALRTNGSHLATSRDSLDQTSSHADPQYGDLLHLESELTSLQEGLHRFENFPQPASGSFDPFEEFGMHSSTDPVPIKRAENGLKTKTEPDPFTMAPFQEKVHAPSPSLTSSISSKPRTYLKELRPNSKSPFPNSEMPLYPPPLPPPLAHRSPSNKREEAKKMSTAVPRPSSSNSPALQPPQASPLRTTFSTNFNVDPFHHNDSFVASFPVSMAAKPPPSLAVDSPASRASQDPPFGDKYAVFAGLSEEIVHQQPNEPHASATHLFRGPAAHLSTSNTTFEADFGDTFDFNAETEFQDSASKNNESSVFDIFTELDPLGTGKSKPYVDKKDFFKDLKKPLEKPALKVLAGEEERQAVNVPKDLQMVLETSYKQQQTPRSTSQSRPAPKPAELDFEIEDTDPFGSIHFVPPPETDPFDTDITSAGVFFTPAPALPSSPLLNAKRKQFQAAESLSSISFHATLPRGPLKVTLPIKEDANEPKEGRKLSPLRRSDTGSPLSSRKQFTLDDSSPLAFPTLQPPPRHEKTTSTTLPRPLRQASLTRQTPDTPPLPPLPRMEDLTLWRIESAQDKELRAQEQAEQQHSSQDSLNEPPDPPPRPPLVKPPPLPPKGQPPLPQRPLAATVSLSSSNEDETNSSTSFGKAVDTPTPPLPTPLRKSRERQKSPLIKTDSSLSVTSSNTETGSKDKTVTKTSVKKKKQKAKAERADLSQISLVQLSSMSISQLADTLELPAERLTAMTLTELALRLNQLSSAQQDDEEEEEEQDNGEEDEEDEQEYVTLSDAPEPEDEDIENEEELENEDEVQNLVRAVTDSPPSTLTDQTEPQSAKNLDESAEDKYAALREITFLSEPEVALAEQKWPTFDSPLEEEVAERRDSTSVPAFADFADFPPAELAEESKTDLEDAFDQDSDWANPQSVSRPDSVPLPVPTSATASPSFNFTSTFDDDFGRQTPAEINGVRPKATTPSFPRLSRTSESEKLGKKLTHSTRLGSRRESWNSGAGSDTEADVFGQPAWSAVEEPEADLSFGRENVLRSSGGSSGKSERRSQSQPRPSTHSPRSWVTLEVDAGPEWSSSKGISRKSSSSSHYSQQRTSPKVEPPAFEDSFVPEDSTTAPWAEVEEEKARAEEEEDKFADFGAVFGNSKRNGSNGKVGTDLDAVHLKKSQSVNIFKAEGDPFDDDFFQKQSKVDTVSNAGFQTVVEDPFAWVQPFDTFHFQDEFDA